MATRLHVGGLGERVTEDDLRNTFSRLGSLQTVEIIRTKGRSFAYINFLPSSDNSLAKLFSMYNGCLWKGGKLKLEKAKEHYIDQLEREWAEDAELVKSEDTNHSDVDEKMAASSEPKSTLDFEKMQLRMFFPKLSKIKSLPFRGTGKHKYSFQRVEVPPLPVHFCDCPEHSHPVQAPKVKGFHDSDILSDKIDDEEINMMNSVLNRLLNKKTSRKSECIQPRRGAQVHEDGGMNDKETHVTNSVMQKKILDRENAKTEKNFQDSPQIPAPTFELQEDKNEIDEETDDDDIKINTVVGEDLGSDSWELETSLVDKMASSNEQWTFDGPIKSNPGTQNAMAKPSNKKRKSVANEGNENDSASPSHRKKARLPTQSNESEEHLESQSVTESETKKSVTNGLWSQKSTWKELVGDGKSASFHLSHITPGGETNSDERPISSEETSADSKKHIAASSDSKELERVSDSDREDLDGESSQSKEIEGIQAAQLAEPSAGLDTASRGSSWLQKSSWTQLVSSGNSTFSISQILPADLLEKQQLNKSNDSSTLNCFYSSGALVNEQRTRKTAFGGTRSLSGLVGTDKKKDAQASATRGTQPSKAPKGNDHSDSTITNKSDIDKKVSDTLPGVDIGETCPFMRSADSLKDWQTAKAALTGALKKRNNNK